MNTFYRAQKFLTLLTCHLVQRQHKLYNSFQQIKIAVGEEVVLRGQRRQRAIHVHSIAKRESPIDDEDEGTYIEDDIYANEEEEERYSLSQTYYY